MVIFPQHYWNPEDCLLIQFKSDRGNLSRCFVVSLYILKCLCKWLPWYLSWSRIHLQCRRPWFDSWVRKIHWRMDRLPTPVFLGFPGGSAGKESACNADLGSIPVLGRPWRREQLPTPVFWPREFHGLCSSWGHKESNTIERLSLLCKCSIFLFF